jgi:hypothetical protein
MMPKEIARKYSHRVLAWMSNIAEQLRERDISVDGPYALFDSVSTDFHWLLVIYPLKGESPSPNNALDMRFQIIWSGRDDNFSIRAALDLTTVEGTDIGGLGHGLVPGDDLSRFEAQIQDFENPNTIKDVVDRVEAYIRKARREGPREWSPRWEKPSMGAAEKPEKLEDPISINIVERKGWEPWRSDELSELAQALSDEYYKAIVDTEGCDLIEKIMGEHYKWGTKEGPREWSPRGGMIGLEGIKKACIGLKDNQLEGVDSMIRDTANFMYEDALTPDDEDIRYAMQEAKEDWYKKYELTEWLWEPILEKNRTERSILLGFMNKIDYTRKQGYYDRYIVFDFRSVSEVLSLLHAWPAKDFAEIKKALENEYRSLVESFLEEFFKELAASMKDRDPENRADFKKHWKFMLSDKPRVEAVRKEIREFVKQAPELPEDEE